MLLAAVAALSAVAAETPPWQSERYRDHALVGRIWDVRAGRAVSAADVAAAIGKADYVLLGESHDNVDHHRLQDEMLRAALPGTSRPALAMEQFDRDYQAALDAARAAAAPLDAEALADAGKLNRKGWKWPQHKVLVETAIAHRLPVIAANLSRESARGVFARGFAVLPGYDEKFFAATWRPSRERSLRDELIEGHCGQLDEAMAPGMMRAQRARDAVMADAMLTAPRAVLVAGRGHVRRDRGVPAYVRARKPDAAVIAVGFTEVKPGAERPGDYFDAATGDEPPFDYLWFTPAAARKDPCEGIDLSKLGKSGGKTP